MTRAAQSSAQRKLDSATLAALLDAAQVDVSQQSLKICHVGLTPNLAVQIADFLEVNHSLTELDLTGNAIGSHGASCIAASLRKNDTLQRLTLASCGLKSDVVKPFADYFQHYADADEGKPFTLRYINLSNNQIEDDAAEELGALVAATATEISHQENSEPVALALDLRCNWLSDESIRSVARAIQHNNSIRTLRLEGNQADDDATAIAQKQIAFCLQRNTHNHQRHKTLQQIVHVRDGFVSSFEALYECKFEFVELSMDDAQLLSDALHSNRSLTSLQLRDNALSVEAMRRILTSVASHRNMRSINLQDNSMGEIGFLAVNRLLQQNTALRGLSIIHSTSAQCASAVSLISRQTLAALHRTLAMDTLPLKSLALVNCGLGDMEIGVLVSGIAWACGLESLELRNNAFTDHSVGVFVRLLQRCSRLARLDVSGNQLQLSGAAVIARAATSHHSMRCLLLGRFAEYDAATIQSIVLDLQASTTLIRVELSTKSSSSRCAGLVNDLNESAQWQSRRTAFERARRRQDAHMHAQDTQQALYHTIARHCAVHAVTTWLQHICKNHKCMVLH